MTNQSVAKELETTARRRPKRRRLADEALRESEERFRTIVDASPDAVVLTDIEGRIRMASLAALDLFGCQGEDLRGRPIADFVKPGERGRARNLIQEVLHDGGPSPRQYMGLRGDGITVALEVNSRVIRGAEGRPAEILLLIRDVTQRIQTHAALAASEGRFRTMVNASPDTITITDLASRIVMISPAGLEMLGYEEPADLTGRSVEEFLAEEDRERARANIALMFEGVFKGPEQYGIRRADGSLVEVEINGDFIRDESGTATHVVYVIRDITERNRAQADLRASEERHRTILQTAMDASGWWIATDGCWTSMRLTAG